MFTPELYYISVPISTVIFLHGVDGGNEHRTVGHHTPSFRSLVTYFFTITFYFPKIPNARVK